MKYVEPNDAIHPNRIHIKIEIPHQDGMILLISTFPIHNMRLLLSDSIYQRQHTCSNFVDVGGEFRGDGFIDDDRTNAENATKRGILFDENIREEKSLKLYRKLDLKSCAWTFEAWYHMTDLIDMCGGSVLSDFQMRKRGKTFLTFRLPLYVSYIYASAPSSWASLEHRTTMEFSFFYDTVLWRSGLEADGRLGGRLQVLRVATNPDGNLVIEFSTETRFRGQFVLNHYTFPGYKSRVNPPPNLPVTFDLALVWSQPTYAGPDQLWRTTSKIQSQPFYKIDLSFFFVLNAGTFGIAMSSSRRLSDQFSR
ncbi:extracellular matrix organizing protein FRAS1-like [Tubulanus polymorphus]|uniref:extracellular matrix organizing protein FRAS1-like n=1 Tax=Tubulanus polymorphus TaxID=672921 RepID=UPI003DA5AA80